MFNSNFVVEPGARIGRSRPRPLNLPAPAPDNGAAPDPNPGRLAAILSRALEPFPEVRRAVIEALRDYSAGSL